MGACLEMLPLSSCVAGTSGSYLNVKDTETCSTGYTMETSTDQLATYNGEDLSIGSKALASYLKGTGKDLRKFHTYVEVANIQYYTHGCDSVLASPGRRLLAAAGVTEADVNKVIGAAEVTKELVAVQKQLDDLKALIDVPKDSYNSGSAKDAYDSASAQLHALTENYEALRGSASSYADQALDWKAKFDTEKQRTSGKTTHELEGGVIAALVVLGVLVLGLGIAVCYMMRPSKESSSEPEKTRPRVDSEGNIISQAQYRPLFRQAVDL